MHKPDQEISKAKPVNNKTWQIMYKTGPSVTVKVFAVFNKNHDLRLTDPEGKVYLFKYKSNQHHLAKQGTWCLGTLINLKTRTEVLIANVPNGKSA